MYLCISVSVYLYISISLYLCIYVSFIARSANRTVTSSDPNKRADAPPNGEHDEETEDLTVEAVVDDEEEPKALFLHNASEVAGEHGLLPKFSPDKLLEQMFLYTTKDG